MKKHLSFKQPPISHLPAWHDDTRRHPIDDLDEIDSVLALGEEVVDVHTVDVKRVDPHAEHALLATIAGVVNVQRGQINFTHTSLQRGTGKSKTSGVRATQKLDNRAYRVIYRLTT